LLGGPLVADRLQGSGSRFCCQDAFYGLAITGVIPAGMAKGQIDVVSVIAFLQMQDVPGVETGIACMHREKPLEKLPGMLPQVEKLLPDRFEAIANGPDPVNRRAIPGDPSAGRRPFMADDDLKFRRVDDDLLLRGLHRQDVGHMLVWDGIAVGLELEVSFEVADPKRHFRAVIGMKRQRPQGRKLLFEEDLQRRPAGGVMHMGVAPFADPPAGAGAEIVEILKLAAAQEIALHVLKRALDLPLRFGPASTADDRVTAIVGDEGGKGRVDHRPPRLPAQDDRLLAVVETLGRDTRKMREGVLVAANQGEKISS